jgi:hypothetical protein
MSAVAPEYCSPPRSCENVVFKGAGVTPLGGDGEDRPGFQARKASINDLTLRIAMTRFML